MGRLYERLLVAVVGAMCLGAVDAWAGVRLLEPAGPYRTQWALVIGINYEGREEAAADGVTLLQNAEADAQAVAATLKAHYGYTDATVKLLLGREATKEAIERLFGDHFLCDPDVVGRDDSVLVFFAGHGDRQTRDDRSRAVLWPYDVQTIPGKGVDSSSCVRINNLLQDLELCAARHKLIILDSCHSGEVFRSGGLARSSARFRFDAEIFGKDVLQAMAASRGFQKALDGMQHSPFTLALLEALHGGVDSSSFGASALFARVPERVREISSQSPRGGTISGDGEFYFFRHSDPEMLDLAAFDLSAWTRGGAGDGAAFNYIWLIGPFVLAAAGLVVLTLLYSLRSPSYATAAVAPPAGPDTLVGLPHAGELHTYRVSQVRDVTMAAGSTSRCTLKHSGSAAEIVCVFGTQTDLGRSRECGFRFPHRQISSEHARLRYVAEDDAFVVEDLGSRNGTYVVGRKVSDDMTLETGVRVMLAQSPVLEFRERRDSTGASVAELVHANAGGDVIGRYFLVPGMRFELSLLEPDAMAGAADAAAAIEFEADRLYVREQADGSARPVTDGEAISCGNTRVTVCLPA